MLLEHCQKGLWAELATIHQCGLAFMVELRKAMSDHAKINDVCIIDSLCLPFLTKPHSGGGGWGCKGGCRVTEV